MFFTGQARCFVCRILVRWTSFLLRAGLCVVPDSGQVDYSVLLRAGLVLCVLPYYEQGSVLCVGFWSGGLVSCYEQGSVLCAGF